MRHQIANPHRLKKATLDDLDPRMLKAARHASRVLTDLGVPHLLIGGLAVVAHGHLRTTADIDFLVGGEVLRLDGAILSFVPGVPLVSSGFAVNNILIGADDYDILRDALDRAAGGGTPIPIAPLAILVLMKLRAGRRQDLADVEALLRLQRAPQLQVVVDFITVVAKHDNRAGNASGLTDDLDNILRDL